MTNQAPKKLPLMLYGKIVGEALVGPDGQIFIDIDSTPQGKELRDILTDGWIDHFTLVPQNHFTPKDYT